MYSLCAFSAQHDQNISDGTCVDETPSASTTSHRVQTVSHDSRGMLILITSAIDLKPDFYIVSRQYGLFRPESFFLN